ncbi:MAG: 30S ribosomal protein S6 [Candidatus Omnitrophica bacterium]|nr:30S ribosomal protein S6 [Candidatus Omnitrophota bacterium]MCM8798200.1 30S ribosomal protein S6 [Candidatus Omnitrophota bacterium]
MRNYEALILVNPELNEENLEKEIKQLSQPILHNEGRVISFEKWRKRPLAYKIKKFKEGVYLLVKFSANPLAIKEIEKSWKLDENVLRTMIVVKENL